MDKSTPPIGYDTEAASIWHKGPEARSRRDLGTAWRKAMVRCQREVWDPVRKAVCTASCQMACCCAVRTPGSGQRTGRTRARIWWSGARRPASMAPPSVARESDMIATTTNISRANHRYHRWHARRRMPIPTRSSRETTAQGVRGHFESVCKSDSSLAVCGCPCVVPCVNNAMLGTENKFCAIRNAKA